MFAVISRFVAEGKGFEPLWAWAQTVFKTASLWPLRYPSVNMMQQRASYLRSLVRCGSMSLLIESTSHTPLGDRQARLSGAECGYLRSRRTIPLMHTVHYHRIFNFFRNIFRNALLWCFGSARKVSVYKAFLRFCDRYARKFSRPPRYDRFDNPPYEIV